MPKAFYMGKRMVGRMPRHSMCDNEGNSWHYPKAKDVMFFGAQIGHEYETEHTQSSGASGFALPGRAGWRDAATGNVHEDALQWEGEHRLALEIKKASNAAPDQKVQEHVGALRSACDRMSTSERAKFLTYLITTFMSWRR